MPVSRSTGEETNFVPGQAVFELTMHQCIEAGQAFDSASGLRASARVCAPALGLRALGSSVSVFLSLVAASGARLALASHEDCAPP